MVVPTYIYALWKCRRCTNEVHERQTSAGEYNRYPIIGGLSSVSMQAPKRLITQRQESTPCDWVGIVRICILREPPTHVITPFKSASSFQSVYTHPHTKTSSRVGSNNGIGSSSRLKCDTTADASCLSPTASISVT